MRVAIDQVEELPQHLELAITLTHSHSGAHSIGSSVIHAAARRTIATGTIATRTIAAGAVATIATIAIRRTPSIRRPRLRQHGSCDEQREHGKHERFHAVS